MNTQGTTSGTNQQEDYVDKGKSKQNDEKDEMCIIELKLIDRHGV
jgi:hypothetical protein